MSDRHEDLYDDLPGRIAIKLFPWLKDKWSTMQPTAHDLKWELDKIIDAIDDEDEEKADGEKGDSDGGWGCLVVILFGILVWFLLGLSERRTPEMICAEQTASHETPFCKALAEKYRMKP